MNFHGLGDDPASVAEIIAAGFDPGAPGVTYTVDSDGNVLPNLTSTAPAPATAARPIWPLLVVLAAVGYAVFYGGQHSR